MRKRQQVQVLPFSKELHCTSFSVLSVTLSCDLICFKLSYMFTIDSRLPTRFAGAHHEAFRGNSNKQVLLWEESLGKRFQFASREPYLLSQENFSTQIESELFGGLKDWRGLRPSFHQQSSHHQRMLVVLMLILLEVWRGLCCWYSLCSYGIRFTAEFTDFHLMSYVMGVWMVINIWWEHSMVLACIQFLWCKKYWGLVKFGTNCAGGVISVL